MMTMFITTLVVASIFTCSRVSSVSYCQLPQVSAEIDIGKVQGDWYVSAHQNQEMFNVIRCEVSTSTKTEQGFTAYFKIYNGGNSSNIKEVRSVFNRVAPSTFHIVQSKGYSDEIAEIKKEDTNSGAEANIVLENDSVIQNPLLFISDNKTYKLILHCNLNGGKEILVETRTPSAKSEVILKVRNKLIEFGNGWEDVKVYPSQCDRVIGK
uniref:uncharacterized protein LOC120339836 isoform X1 n=1 Tax=Styela clava TaxID=7725 RepID=UPI00193AAA6F|nr:uncharacterized protein LOC120339836 isoform X1 [Styela clava]